MEKDVFPLSTTFQMIFANASVFVDRDTSINPVTSFQTGSVVSSSGNATMYYVAGWRSFYNGMLLLPGDYTFAFSDRPNEVHAIAVGIENVIP